MRSSALLAFFATAGCAGVAPTLDAEPGRFPNVQLRTHDGRTVRFYDDLLRDKTVVINFMYLDCKGICPGVTENLARVQHYLGDRLGKDLFIYSFTLDGEEDTPEELRAYAQASGARPGWVFLTGAKDDIRSIRRSLGILNEDPKEDADKSQHLGVLRFGNDRHSWWAACPSLSDPRQIATSVLWTLPPD